MNGFELKAFAAVHRHQPHGIQMQRGGGDLAQIAFFGEQDELAHTIQRPLDRQASAHRHLLAREVQELPEGDGAHLGGEAFRLAKLLREVRAIQQIGGEEIPGARIRAQAGQLVASRSTPSRPAVDKPGAADASARPASAGLPSDLRCRET